MRDGWEENYGLNPCNASDRFLDIDNDGLANYYEFKYSNSSSIWSYMSPNNPDTDGDGILDSWEFWYPYYSNLKNSAIPKSKTSR